MPREKDPYRQAVYELPKVKKFIDRKNRKKANTGETYLNSLVHFNRYLVSEHQKNCDTIVEYLEQKPKEVYDILDGFIVYLTKTLKKVSPTTISNYMHGLRSYFPSYDIDIIPSKFKNKVDLPKKYKVKERPIKKEEIRILLNSCNNRRLKSYILFLATSGCRASSEACNVRNKDVDFTASPTKIYIRAEFTKTNTARYFYISDEATNHLKQFLDWKYSEKQRYVQEDGSWKTVMVKQQYNDNDLIFSVYDKDTTTAKSLYTRLAKEWMNLLDTVNLNQKKEGGFEGRTMRQLTLNSFRRWVYTTVEKQVNTGYAEYLLGHANSPYHTEPEDEIRNIYKDKCMSYLTFTDYSALEAKGKSIEAKLEEKDSQVTDMKNQIVQLEEKIQKMGENFFQWVNAVNTAYDSDPEVRKRRGQVIKAMNKQNQKNLKGLKQAGLVG